ncbi:MAG: GtrA family protein [Oscillospiraceae bacterium]|nr:GtrA family protein [Oscillospiraceae bacterium]
MNEEKDLFDRLMDWKPLRPLQPFWQKHRELLLYLFFGGLTTLLGIFVFWLFNRPFDLNELIANIISWILAVLFAYVTNATWVFSARPANVGEAARQLLSFYAGRLATLGVEELILFVFVTKLDFDSMLVKIVASVVVIILNYVISKLLVFRKKKEEENP